MNLFYPERVFFEKESLNYELGQKIYNDFSVKDVDIKIGNIREVSGFIGGNTDIQKYSYAKKTLVVDTKKSLKLDICKPSADYEFSLVTNCPGGCEYCYLQSTQGQKPYLRVYVNLDEIFSSIKENINNQNNKATTFEAASSGDPLAVEHITGSLRKTIEFFGREPDARLRVVTKYSNVDSLLDASHNGHTRFRFSINTGYVLKNFEHNTSSLSERLEAFSKVLQAGYHTGFIIAPVMVYDGWQKDYKKMIDDIGKHCNLKNYNKKITFEIIQHRFTPTAKKFILARFPKTKLDLNEQTHMLKWGKYGRFKYVYPKETSEVIKNFITQCITSSIPNSHVEYFT